MAQFPNIFNCDLHSGPVSASIRQMYLGDIAANRVGVRVTDNGEAVALSGTCSGTAMLYNGGTVALTGVVDGNVAYVDLPAAVYSVEGPLQIFVTLTQGGSTTTLLEMRSNVTRTETGVVIDPGTIISSVAALISDIEDAVASIPEDYSELSADVVQLKADMEDVQPAVETLEDDVSDLKGAVTAIGNPPKTLDSTKTGVDLDVSDASGKVVMRLADGHIQTKKFDSSEVIDAETLNSAISGVEDQIEEIGREEVSPNLFNPADYEDSEYIDSSFLLNNGTIGTGSSYSKWMVTPKISIDASTQYTLAPKVWDNATGKNRIRAYSSDDTPLAELTVTENADGSATFTSPATASYFRMSYYKNQVSFANSIKKFKESFMLVKGATAPESYVPYFEPYFRLDGKIGPTGMLNPDFMLPLWYGKKMVNFGDSIFGNIRPPKDMSAKIAQYTGAETYNCAFGGCRMGIHSGHWDAFSMYRLAYAIANNDFSVQDEAIQYDDRTSYAEVPLATLKAIDFSTVDMITIAYGTNDFGGGNEDIDNPSDPMDTTTLAGALRYSLDQIMTVYPKIRIVVLGIIYREFSGTSSDTYVNARGNTIAEYNAKLKEVADQYHVRFIDNANIGFNAYTISTYYLDNTHPNDDGLDVYARHFANQIN